MKLLRQTSLRQSAQLKASVRSPSQVNVQRIWSSRRQAVSNLQSVRNTVCNCSNVDQNGQFLQEVTDNRIPVTVISGFLGSGKTTLLNNILSQNHGRRIAVIENEFGAIDIDSDLVKVKEKLDTDESSIVMLSNGCICCSIHEDLIKMLLELISRRDQFDHVIIETTGMAHPMPVIGTFFKVPDVGQHMVLDGVVTVVDVKHIMKRLSEPGEKDQPPEAMTQIAYADRLIINKLDLVPDKAEQAAIKERITELNSIATQYDTEQAKVPVDYVLGVGGYDLDRIDEVVKPIPAEPAPPKKKCGHDHDHDHHEHKHSAVHSDAVNSVSVVVDGDMDLNLLNTFFHGLLAVDQENLYRMKGIIAVHGDDRRYVFQGVHSLVETGPDRPWKEGEPRRTRMVFIGKSLNGDYIREGFMQCVYKEEKEKVEGEGVGAAN